MIEKMEKQEKKLDIKKWLTLNRFCNIIGVIIAILLLIVLIMVIIQFCDLCNDVCNIMHSRSALLKLFVVLFSVITLLVTVLQLSKMADAEQIKAIVALRDLFNQEGNLQVHNRILNKESFDLKEPSDDNKETNKEDNDKLCDLALVNNYIGTLELAYIMVEKNLITEYEFLNLFGYRLEDLSQNKDIIKYVMVNKKYHQILLTALSNLSKKI